MDGEYAYMIIERRFGYPLSRRSGNGTVTSLIPASNITHDDFGHVCMIDVLKAMGYIINGYQTATLPKVHPLGREITHLLDNLCLYRIDLNTGEIDGF